MWSTGGESRTTHILSVPCRNVLRIISLRTYRNNHDNYLQLVIEKVKYRIFKPENDYPGYSSSWKELCNNTNKWKSTDLSSATSVSFLILVLKHRTRRLGRTSEATSEHKNNENNNSENRNVDI